MNDFLDCCLTFTENDGYHAPQAEKPTEASPPLVFYKTKGAAAFQEGVCARKGCRTPVSGSCFKFCVPCKKRAKYESNKKARLNARTTL